MSAPYFGCRTSSTLRLHERALSCCACRNSAAVSLRTFSADADKGDRARLGFEQHRAEGDGGDTRRRIDGRRVLMRSDLDRVRVWWEGRLDRRSHTDLGAAPNDLRPRSCEGCRAARPRSKRSRSRTAVAGDHYHRIDCYRVPPLSPVNQDCSSCTALRPPLRGRLAADSLIICCRQSLVAPMYVRGSGILVSRDTHAP
jgi:hypothetical protein